jgi:transposase
MKRRSYDKEFKRMAAQLHINGKTSVAVGEELGVSPDLVRRWAKELNSHGKESFPGNGNQTLTDEQKQIAALKKELFEAKAENEILKKAVNIFSRNDSKYSGS